MKEGDVLTFNIIQGTKGPQAHQVVKIRYRTPTVFVRFRSCSATASSN